MQEPGVTHITNGYYRLHAVEWGIGEAAGRCSPPSASRISSSHAACETAEARLKAFQAKLTPKGDETRVASGHRPLNLALARGILLSFTSFSDDSLPSSSGGPGLVPAVFAFHIRPCGIRHASTFVLKHVSPCAEKFVAHLHVSGLAL